MQNHISWTFHVYDSIMWKQDFSQGYVQYKHKALCNHICLKEHNVFMHVISLNAKNMDMDKLTVTKIHS